MDFRDAIHQLGQRAASSKDSIQKEKTLFWLMLLLFGMSIVSAEDIRTWTSKNGKHTLEAELTAVSEDGKEVTLKDAKGKSRDVKLKTLCPEDNEYAKKWQDAQANQDAEPDPFQEPTVDEPQTQEVEVDTTEHAELIEVSVGDSLDTVKASCQILSEVCDDRVNWRRLAIQPKNSLIDTYTLYFFDSEDVGLVFVSFKAPSIKLAKKVTKTLSSKFESKSGLIISSVTDSGDAFFEIPGKPNESMSLSYNKREKDETLYLLWQTDQKSISDSMKKLLYPVAKKAILDVLKSPASAVFEEESNTAYEFRILSQPQPIRVLLTMSVDAQNSYGALLRTRYGVIVHYDVEEPSVDINDNYSILEMKRGETWEDAGLRRLNEILGFN